MQGLGSGLELLQVRALGSIDPVAEPLSANLRVLGVHQFNETVFKYVSVLKLTRDADNETPTSVVPDYTASDYEGLPPAVALSLRYFRNGLYCSEAVLKAFNEVYNLGYSEDDYKISTGFGSGLSESGCCCGTVAGCVMVLGLVAGRTKNYESERVVFTATRELHDRFREKHKALCCRVLTKNVKWNSAEHKIQCEQYVLDATMITDELLNTRLKEYLPENGGKKVATKKNPVAIFRRLTDKDEK